MLGCPTRWFVASAWVGLSACASADKQSETEDAAGADTADDAAGEEVATDDEEVVVGDGWVLDGVLGISAGDVSTDESVLQIAVRILNSTTSDTDSSPVECTRELTLVEGPAAASPADVPDAVAWWSVTWAVDDDSSCAWTGPTTVGLGFGAVEDQLRPVADLRGIAIDGDTLGLYLRPGSGAAVAYGLATRSGDLAVPDTDAADTDAGGIEDGLYALTPLYAFAVDD